MTEIYTEIMLFSEDKSFIEALKPLFDDSHPQKNHSVFGDFTVEESCLFDNAIIANIQSSRSFEIEVFIKHVLDKDPEWFFIESHDTSVDEKQKICIKKNNKKTTKKTLLKNMCSASPNIDFYFAIQNQDSEKIWHLIENDAIKLDFEIHHLPALFYILKIGDIKLLKLLHKKGANFKNKISKSISFDLQSNNSIIWVKAIKGMNYISLALEMEQPKIVNFLIKLGLDINEKDVEGNSPIHYAANKKINHILLPDLVSVGADINCENNAGYTPIFYLLCSDISPKRVVEIAKIWINLGADIKHTSKNGMNAFWIAKSEDTIIRDFVIKQGVDFYTVPVGYYDKKDLYENLHKALLCNDFISFKEFLNSDLLDKKQKASLLHSAVSYGHRDIIEHMVNNGIEPYLMEKGYFAHQFILLEKIKKSPYQEIGVYLENQMSEFYSEGIKRIQQAYPYYKNLMHRLKDIATEKEEEKDLELLGNFSNHLFCQELHPKNLGWMTRKKNLDNINYDKPVIQVDDEYNVTFQISTDDFWAYIVEICTKKEPNIISLFWTEKRIHDPLKVWSGALIQ